MNYQKITRLQKDNGVYEMQELINSGQVWKLEGSMGRAAASLLKMGACMLPLQRHADYWGSNIKARTDLRNGEAGSFQHCANYWSEYELRHESDLF